MSGEVGLQIITYCNLRWVHQWMHFEIGQHFMKKQFKN